MNLSDILDKPKEVRRRERVPIVRALLAEMELDEVPAHKRGEFFQCRIPMQFVVSAGMSYEPQPLKTLFPASIIGQRGPTLLVRVLL